MEEPKTRILFRKFIKPSSPTPPNLKTFKLSLLDQITPDLHNNANFFYLPSASDSLDTNDGTTLISDFASKSLQLQNSLSRTLATFYPFAGRFEDDSTIDCNNEGILFIEAETDISLTKFLHNPDLGIVDKHFLPNDDSLTNELAKGSVLLVKFTLFSCGGCAISLSTSHKIVDLASLLIFLRRWTLECRGSVLSTNRQVTLPDFHTGPSLLPSRSEIPKVKTSAVISPKKFAITRLVFRASKIAELKANILSALRKNGKEFYPSRVEVVEALIWKYIMTASMSVTGSFKPSALVQAADLRTRINPPLPPNAVGNLMWMFPVTVKSESEIEMVEMVIKLREVRGSLRDQASKFNSEEVLGVVQVQQTMKDREENMKSFDCCICASWCKFPLLETDFDWGNPVWHTSIAKNLMSDTVYLKDTKEEGGVEALVHLDVEETRNFCQAEEIDQYHAAINPTAIFG